jgi:hypothetical protein
MYIRFIIDRLDSQSGRRQGLFQAAYELRRGEHLTAADDAHLSEILHWFGVHLARPARFALSARPHRKAQALCWFKHGAHEHIARMREVGEIVERYDIFPAKIRTRQPGYVLYEDDQQVAAYPFADTQT